VSFRVLVADPPWPFKDHLPGPARGASKHYDMMTMRDIKRFNLPPMFQDSVLFLWRVAAMQQEALDIISAWDFELKTELVWKKRTVHDKRAFGMGRIVRAEHEVCLIATSGKPHIKTKSVRSVFEATLRRHSEKPDKFYNIVEQLVDGPYVELFARRQRPGWTCLGDEANG
jgi:N6-adenosine-specific RNA methylase IME4